MDSEEASPGGIAMGEAASVVAEEEAHEFGALNTLLLVVVMVICIICAYLIKVHRFYYLPESAAVILVGLMVGFFAKLLSSSRQEMDFLSFQPEVFYFLLLPPIIFDAGYTLRRKQFFQNIVAISLYAVIGTLISTFVIGYVTYFLGRIGMISIDTTDALEPLMFGALISAVDPVATLSIMGSSELNCHPLLYNLVFGESVLNDAVSIVLYHSFQRFYLNRGEVQDSLAILMAIVNFAVVSLGSVVVGTAIGLGCSYLCKNTEIHRYPHFEISLLVLFAYGSYAFAEALELSGIMALFFCGIMLAHYNSYNLSHVARSTVEVAVHTLAQMSEYFVFLYIGMGFFTGRFTRWNVGFILVSIAVCLFARLLNTFPCSFLSNLRRADSKKIPFRMQVVIWFAGLRGAIAFALSQTMPLVNRDLYATTTLSIVIFTTIVCGGLTEPLLEVMEMKVKDPSLRNGDSSDEDSEDETHELLSSARDGDHASEQGVSMDVLGSGSDRMPGDTGCSATTTSTTTGAASASPGRRLYQDSKSRRKAFNDWWGGIDGRFLRPLFGGPDTCRDNSRDNEPSVPKASRRDVALAIKDRVASASHRRGGGAGAGGLSPLGSSAASHHPSNS
mmetsp:Transcript_29353/g.85557  ORF Transcript_29353/g.85557 Transcript_29353/m.85557 type:complete len:617 (-) Transcript_29353:67-1917(-)|eukprot:CAMPEP_0118985206 /NCGR_PEP_ID=MMETSP1173-20130426/39449_1 /TAXON_ID=1034831 /ORGANISM="Rhizochromulina marina cf, Strain CCMP1243" /LENGTH=616 /DNA_ID=CAMNT_0006935911 /DNA_START=66 /DNA_END=1916 /DNA_ORIENTATION=+